MRKRIDIVPMSEGDGRLADGLSLHRFTLQPRPLPHWHAHGFHQVSVFLSRPGRIRWQFGDGLTLTGQPEAGDVIVCPAAMPMLVSWDRSFESASIQLSTDFIQEAETKAGLEPSVIEPRPMRRDPFVGEIARKLIETDGRGRDLLVSSLGTALAVHLLTDYTEAAKPSPEIAGLRPGELRRLTTHINANLDAELSVTHLATLAGLSPDHFIRKFRAATGETPHRFIIRRRVEHAAELIRAGSGIAEAAALAGFSSQSHLHRHTRRLLGVTPGRIARASDSLP